MITQSLIWFNRWDQTKDRKDPIDLNGDSLVSISELLILPMWDSGLGLRCKPSTKARQAGDEYDGDRDGDDDFENHHHYHS